MQYTASNTIFNNGGGFKLIPTEIIKIIEHGIKGDSEAVRAYAKVFAQKCNEVDKKRIENVLNDTKSEFCVCLDSHTVK
jgi:hypothetical protein